nr:hypothetical protein [Pseudopedobacter sp.]
MKRIFLLKFYFLLFLSTSVLNSTSKDRKLEAKIVDIGNLLLPETSVHVKDEKEITFIDFIREFSLKGQSDYAILKAPFLGVTSKEIGVSSKSHLLISFSKSVNT